MLNKLTSREKVLITILVITAVWACVIKFALIPSIESAAAAKSEYTSLKSDYGTVTNLLSANESTKQRLDEQIKIMKAENYFYRSLTEAAVDKELQLQAEKAEVTLDSVIFAGDTALRSGDTGGLTSQLDAFSQLTDGLLDSVLQGEQVSKSEFESLNSDIHSISVSITAEGAAQNIVKMLDNINSMQKSIVVERVEINPARADNNNSEESAVSHSINLIFYFLA